MIPISKRCGTNLRRVVEAPFEKADGYIAVRSNMLLPPSVIAATATADSIPVPKEGRHVLEHVPALRSS